MIARSKRRLEFRSGHMTNPPKCKYCKTADAKKYRSGYLDRCEADRCKREKEKARLRDFYKSFLDKNICVYCRRASVPAGVRLCAPCKTIRNNRVDNHRKRKITDGICYWSGCKRKASPPNRLCKVHSNPRKRIGKQQKQIAVDISITDRLKKRSAVDAWLGRLPY